MLLDTNIPQKEGVQSVSECLEENPNPTVPSHFKVRLLEMILKYNIFEFDKSLYQQMVGTAMGSSLAPSYANMFMARQIDKKIKELAQKYGENNESPIKLLKRFLDDIFSVFIGQTEKLHQLFEDINKIHPSIQFTMEHTTPTSIKSEQNPCKCEVKKSIPFLDTLCTIKEGKITTSLYRKPSDKNQYLLTSSCHPAEVTKNVPFSLALRINRICSDPSDTEKAYNELKGMLIRRQYPEKIIDEAITRSRAIP